MQCLPTNLNFWQQKQFTFTMHLFLKFLHQGNKTFKCIIHSLGFTSRTWFLDQYMHALYYLFF